MSDAVLYCRFCGNSELEGHEWECQDPSVGFTEPRPAAMSDTAFGITLGLGLVFGLLIGIALVISLGGPR